MTFVSVSVCAIFLIIYGAWLFSPSSFGQEGIPAGATLLKEIDFHPGVECNRFCGGDLSDPYDAALLVDGGIYKISDTSVYIKITISRMSTGGVWDYSLRIKDNNGVQIATYSNVQDGDDQWHNEELNYTVAKMDSYSFEMTGKYNYTCCSDYTSHWDYIQQAVVYDCLAHSIQEPTFSDTLSISLIDWTLIIGIVVGTVIVVAVVAVILVKRKGATDDYSKMAKRLRWK